MITLNNKNTIVLCLLFLIGLFACNKNNKNCPPVFKIKNASLGYVDIKLYDITRDTIQEVNVIKQIDSMRIESNAYFENPASDDNPSGMPLHFQNADSLELIFDNNNKLYYTKTYAPVSGNILNIHHYVNSKSEIDCKTENEVIYHISEDHKRASK